MKLFVHAHATHRDWRMAVALAAAQIEAQRHDAAATHIRQPTLGWVYFSDHYSPQAEDVFAELQRRWPGVAWVGGVGVGVSANGVEYFDEPAIVLMLCDLPHEQFFVFSGARPMSQAPAGFEAATAQVHAEGRTEALEDMMGDLADRTTTGYLFGGLISARNRFVHIADGVFEGGLSGVAFAPGVSLFSRVTQGCQPVGPVRHVTRGERNVVAELDGEPALDVLLRDLGVDSRVPREALPRIRETLAGLSAGAGTALSRPGQFGADTRVRHIVGIDPGRGAVALADEVEAGMQLAFCRRDTEAARRDLVRICAELREEVEPEALTVEAALALQGARAEQSPHPAGRIAGAIYVSCLGRGGPHFGGPSAELAIVRRALGDVPLVGFFASGEIAHRHLYGYTGVLTVFPSSE
jgi:small ligand-binding sensory domain FIST